jgi:S1-C subfamily serine protease
MHSRLKILIAVVVLSLVRPVSAALPDVIDRIKPSVLVIGTFAKTRNPSFAMKGTGFVVGDGTLVATNAHVVPEALNAAIEEVLVVVIPTVRGHTAQRVARIVGNDKDHDLTLLRIEGTPLPALAIQGEAAVREGQNVAFMGFPIGNALGLVPVTHRAMISAITPIAMPGDTARQLNEKVISRLRAGPFEVYQLDGTAYPGNSGGPLFDAESGEVIGIVNMVFVKGSKESALTNPSGISFAVPASHLHPLLENAR